MLKQPPNKHKPEKGTKKFRPALEGYAKYTAIAFQMAAIIGVGVWGGIQLDKWLLIKTPAFTVTLSLLSVVLAIYIVIKDLLRKK